jgi:hypothetical protein
MALDPIEAALRTPFHPVDPPAASAIDPARTPPWARPVPTAQGTEFGGPSELGVARDGWPPTPPLRLIRDDHVPAVWIITQAHIRTN